MTIYREVEKPEDIRKINEMIREDMSRAKDLRELEKYLDRSRYLITLSAGCVNSPTHPWRSKFSRSECEKMLKIAREEYEKTKQTYLRIKKLLEG